MAEGTEPAERTPDATDTEALRALLRNGVASIHQSPEAKMTPSTYMELYTAVSKLITRKKYEDGKLLGGTIYKDVSKFLAEHLQSVAKSLESQDDSALLSAYFAEWDQYASSATKVDRIMNLLNRHYIQRNISEGKKGIYPILLLHFVQWQSQVWEKVSSRVIDCAQRAVEMNDGNAGKVKDMIQSFEKLQVDSDTIPEDDDRTTIRKGLEAPFVLDVEKLEREVDEIAATQRGRE
ncbi:cullin 1 [Fusarium sporotrichioides]|uniref:Cullin 1 n=1 Tax=Fusarium sporotrichioides TaxID=5514 RepID=A0A395RVY2_FUSSP|nr:cullin 1 [Fusarium sporotrichioides]